MKAKTILNTSGALITLGGAAVGSYYALNSKPSLNKTKEAPVSPKLKQKTNRRISEWLQSSGNKVVLSAHDTTKSDAWNNKWNKFKQWYENNNQNSEWEIYDWNTNRENGEGYKKFQELCKSNSEKEVDKKDAKLVTEVIMHCVEEVN